MAIKILTTGDIHLGKVSSSTPARSSEVATKNTWQKIVNYAIENEVDAVALTGDIIDQDNRYYEAIGPLQIGFEKLNNAGISVIIVAGNHDFEVLPQIMRHQKTTSNVHFLGNKGTWETKTITIKNQKIQFVGWSFPTLHYNRNPMSSFDSKMVNSNHIVVGLVHGDVGNLKSQYAPINLHDFYNTQVDVWLLGHIHKPQVLNEAKPLIIYPGSPHAMSPKEQGIHGPFVLNIHTKESIEIQQTPLSLVRYELLEFDCTGKDDVESLRNSATSFVYDEANQKELYNVRHLVYDLRLIGKQKNIEELTIWAENIKGYRFDIHETKVSIRKIEIDVEPTIENIEELAKGESIIAVLAQSIIALQNNETTPFLEKIKTDWKSVDTIKKAPIYTPLKNSQIESMTEKEEINQLLLKECNHILSNLLNQQ